jgi:type I restriction enzyme M protein
VQYVREFCEDRAFIRAVVSLPQGVFKSAKADVKTSLLFVQKFTESEGEKFVLEKQRALEETQENHKVGLERLAAVIDEPNAKAADFLTEQENPPPEQRRAAAEAAKRKNEKLRERRAVAKRERSALQEEIRCEARALLKERLDYPVFMYEATRVGVTTTGEDDLNELYPNAKQPPGVKETCLELYQQFCRDPAPFFAQGFRD